MKQTKYEKTIAALLKNQGGPSVLNVYPTMEAAWDEEIVKGFVEKLPQKQREDARFIFYIGVQAAANLMIYCAGHAQFEVAADQITADCLAYQKEAMRVLKERQAVADTPETDQPN